MIFDIYAIGWILLIINFVSLINDKNDIYLILICLVLTSLYSIENPVVQTPVHLLGSTFIIIATMINSIHINEKLLKHKIYLITFMMIILLYISYEIINYKNSNIFYISLFYPFICYILTIYCYTNREHDVCIFLNCLIHVFIHVLVYILLNTNIYQ